MSSKEEKQFEKVKIGLQKCGLSEDDLQKQLAAKISVLLKTGISGFQATLIAAQQVLDEQKQKAK